MHERLFVLSFKYVGSVESVITMSVDTFFFFFWAGGGAGGLTRSNWWSWPLDTQCALYYWLNFNENNFSGYMAVVKKAGFGFVVAMSSLNYARFSGLHLHNIWSLLGQEEYNVGRIVLSATILYSLTKKPSNIWIQWHEKWKFINLK